MCMNTDLPKIFSESIPDREKCLGQNLKGVEGVT